MASLSAQTQLTWLANLQTQFPMIGLRLSNDLQQRGLTAFREDAEAIDRIVQQERRINEMVMTPLGLPSGQTLYQALDDYEQYLCQKYLDKPSLRPQLRSVALLRGHTPDQRLNKLDADRIETWLAYWCRRPVGRSDKPLAFTTCRNVLIDLRRFLRWLNRSPAFEWTLPAAFTFPRCKIAKTHEDRVVKRLYFKRSELRTIWRYSRPWDRALILLALNCGFGKREIATLQVGEVTGGFIKRHRTKTDVYAEWKLWPETQEALDYLARYRPAEGRYVIVNRAGKPLVSGTPRGNENQTIKNHWDNLFKRLKKDYSTFHKLPFKCLRKTGATYLRHLMTVGDAAELSSMYLAQGEQADSGDQLLPAYTSRPWKKLHRALGKLRKKLLPIFTSVEEHWTETVMRITPKQVEKIKELRNQGKTLEAIASEVGLHWVTVGKVCRKSADGVDSAADPAGG